jgi:hypothetical protein
MAALLETERESADSFFASAPPLQDRELITSDVQKFVSRHLQLGMSGFNSTLLEKPKSLHSRYESCHYVSVGIFTFVNSFHKHECYGF